MAEYIVDTTDGILDARTTGEVIRCRDCVHFGRCPMRKCDSPNNPCSKMPNGCDYDWSEA